MVLLKASRGVKLEKALESSDGTVVGRRSSVVGKNSKRELPCSANDQRPTTDDQELTGGGLLYWLLYSKLFHYFPPFRIFRYLTFRTAFASLTAMFTGLIIGPLVINRLREFQIGQYIREEGPKAHQKKAGTPTMGGVLIVISIIVPTLLWADLSNLYIWMAVLSTLAFAAIGFADDYTKVVRKRNLGLTARAKSGLQIVVSVLIAVALIAMQNRGLYSTGWWCRFSSSFILTWWWTGLSTILICGRLGFVSVHRIRGADSGGLDQRGQPD